MDEIVAAVLREFAGKEVSWTGDPGRTDCVRGFALRLASGSADFVMNVKLRKLVARRTGTL